MPLCSPFPTRHLLSGKGNGTFDAPTLVTDQFDSGYQILTDDFNQDGKADLTVLAVEQSSSTFAIGAF